MLFCVDVILYDFFFFARVLDRSKNGLSQFCAPWGNESFQSWLELRGSAFESWVRFTLFFRWLCLNHHITQMTYLCVTWFICLLLWVCTCFSFFFLFKTFKFISVTFYLYISFNNDRCWKVSLQNVKKKTIRKM